MLDRILRVDKGTPFLGERILKKKQKNFYVDCPFAGVHVVKVFKKKQKKGENVRTLTWCLSLSLSVVTLCKRKGGVGRVEKGLSK